MNIKIHFILVSLGFATHLYAMENDSKSIPKDDYEVKTKAWNAIPFNLKTLALIKIAQIWETNTLEVNQVYAELETKLARLIKGLSSFVFEKEESNELLSSIRTWGTFCSSTSPCTELPNRVLSRLDNIEKTLKLIERLKNSESTIVNVTNEQLPSLKSMLSFIQKKLSCFTKLPEDLISKMAALKASLKELKKFLADVDSTVSRGGTLWFNMSLPHFLEDVGNVDVMDSLLTLTPSSNVLCYAKANDYNKTLNSMTTLVLTALAYASVTNKQMLLFLIGKGLDCKVADEYDRTLLHELIKKTDRLRDKPEENSLEILPLLLEHGVPVNAQDTHGTTALHLAVAKGLGKIATYLLNKGANPNLRSSDYLCGKIGVSRTPLGIAQDDADYYRESSIKTGNPLESEILSHYLDLIELMEQKQKELLSKYELLTPEFLSAAAVGNQEAIERLLKERVNINCTDSKGNTALMLAAGCGRTDTVLYLLSKGAKKTLRNIFGKSAYDLADSAGQDTITSILED